MGKSVNEYYVENMKKLMEMQKARGNTARLASPAQNPNNTKNPPSDGKGYYEQFRHKVENDKRSQSSGSRPQRPQSSQQKAPQGGNRPSERTERIKISPEQTQRDRYEENARYVEAMQTAKKARVRRRLKDAAISLGLIFALLIAIGVVLYRLLFVINDLTVVGSESYTEEELLLAAGVMEGDHLYSFSSKDKGELISLRCPEVCEVDVERTPPGKIVFNITEEEPIFYAEFYGEYRTLTRTLRVLDSISLEDAKSNGYIKLILPDIKSATAGVAPEFSSVRSDAYIYEVANALVESKLYERAGTVDLSDKFSITMSVDGKYKIKLGDSESVDVKLRIANAVLGDEMFSDDKSAIIDVTDLSQTSVVVDSGLDLD